MRLIDADALIDKLKDWRGDAEDVDRHDSNEVGYYAGMSRAIRFTALSHTIDAVPVVRCKDCRWYDSAFSACDKYSYCVCEDFYCANGEREA